MSNFVLTLKLDVNPYQEDILDTRLEIGRQIYNACLNELYKRYRLMTESKEYCSAMKLPKTDKKKNKLLKKLNITYGLTEYSLHNFVAPMQKHFKKNIDSFTAQKLASRVFSAFEGVIYHTAKKAHFKKYGEMNSLEGKSKETGIRFLKNTLVWNNLSIPVIIRKKDDYAQLALENDLKYCRVVRKGDTYYLQLILEGIPPQKLNKDGSSRHKIGTSTVGIDIGTQTIAICSDKEVKLLELAPEINHTNREIRRLQRKMDRSRRANNPTKYNPDGTINRSNRDPWIKSNHYQSLQKKLATMQSKYQAIRKQSHNRLVNYIISLGTEIYVEEMNYKGLQKRSKKTEKNANGKFKEKKRFGKSLANKAPSAFLTMLDNRLKYLGEELVKINTAKTKASQYNHITNSFAKKDLGERWNIVDDHKVQRDLYSSFLIMNINPNLESVNREKCLKTYNNFLDLHDIEINQLRTSSNNKLSSMGM